MFIPFYLQVTYFISFILVIWVTQFHSVHFHSCVVQHFNKNGPRNRAFVFGNKKSWFVEECHLSLASVQFSHSVVSDSLWPCSTSGFPVHHQLPELAQTHVHRVSDTIQPSHLLLSPSPPASVFASIRVFSSESVLRIRWSLAWKITNPKVKGNAFLNAFHGDFCSWNSFWLPVPRTNFCPFYSKIKVCI